MKKRLRIQQKILVPYLGSILFLFTLFSIFAFITIRSLVKNSIRAEVRELLEWNAGEIRGFLVERGRIPTTLFKDPFLLDWFYKYNQFRAPIQNDLDYHRIISLFQTLLKDDSTLNSVYFAVENTEEYFDEEGRFDQDGYYVKDRPWWHKAIQMNRFYCEQSGYDYEDSTMAASLQMPVYYPANHLLGVGGIDIEIKTISKLVENMKYKGQGQAFMLNESGDVFAFPGYNTDLYYMQPLQNLNKAFSAKGFDRLAKEMQRSSKNMVENVRWKGIPHLVYFTMVQSAHPYFRWQLAFMIPEYLVDDPVRQITWKTMRWIFVLGILIILFGTWRTLRVLKPLDALSSRLHLIANEKSDLTQALPVQTHDAIGQTAKNFNAFMEQIRHLVSSMIRYTHDVAERINRLNQVHNTISDSGQEMSSKVSQVATTSGEMIQHVEEAMLGVREVARLSKQFLEIVDKGKLLVQERMQRMAEMTQETLGLYEDMQKLHSESKALIEMVKVIDDINERISLLSINASIEAVKAGEKGQGFAVVAKEIETLSQGTSDANRRTLEVVHSFSESMLEFEQDLQTMKETMINERHSFTAISEMFMFLADQAQHTDKAAVQMQIENQQQVESLQMINDSIQHISDAAKQVATSITDCSEQIRNVNEEMKALQKSAEAFKVD